jgi:hypothetical protein
VGLIKKTVQDVKEIAKEVKTAKELKKADDAGKIVWKKV